MFKKIIKTVKFHFVMSKVERAEHRANLAYIKAAAEAKEKGGIIEAAYGMEDGIIMPATPCKKVVDIRAARKMLANDAGQVNPWSMLTVVTQ
jgi:hypothetical protein